MNKKLTGLLAEIFNIHESELKPELSKADIKSWDSLKQMDLVLSLEREYSLSLELEDIVRMITVADIIAVLESKGVQLED